MTNISKNTLELAQQAVKTLNGYKNDKIIMRFVTNEALEKTAQDLRAKTGSGTTAKAVKLLLIKGSDKTVAERFNNYINAGLVGCYMAAMS